MCILLMFTKCWACALSEVIAIKAKVLKVNCFRDNRSTGIVLMLNALSSRNWGIAFIIQICQKKSHTSRVYSCRRYFQRCWSNYKISSRSLNIGKGFGINTFEQTWIVGSDMTPFLQSKLKWNQTTTLKGRQIGRGPNWCMRMKIVSSISKSKNDGKIDKDSQAGENNCNIVDFIRQNFVHCFWNLTWRR